MTCQDAIAILADYLDATLGPADAETLAAHLQDCAACLAYLNTYRAARALAAESARVEMPDEMKRRLREFLIARLGEV